MELSERKRLLSSFRVFVRNLPIRYACIVVSMKGLSSTEDASTIMKRRLIDFFFDHLAYFQTFDAVKIYYDNGQKSIGRAVHAAVEYALAKEATAYRAASPAEYRLSQVADYICTVELAAKRYQNKCANPTDEKFFGSGKQFRKSLLKEVRAKRL